MNFMSVREFRSSTGRMRRELDCDEEIILTANGRPFAMVTALHAEVFDQELRAIRRAKARVALDRIRKSAAQSGTAEMSMSEIDDVIADVRKDNRQS